MRLVGQAAAPSAMGDRNDGSAGWFANRVSRMTSSAPKKAPLSVSRGDRDGAQVWIRGALNAIIRDGADTLRVEKLARDTGVSKGSFYWFFDGLDDLQSRTLEYWKISLNDVVFDQVRDSEGTLEERLCLLVDIVFRGKLGRYDAAIRAWGLRDSNVRSFAEKIDHERLVLLEELFAGNEPPSEESRQRAHLFYRAFIAESYLREYPGKERDDAYLKELACLLANTRFSGTQSGLKTCSTA